MYRKYSKRLIDLIISLFALPLWLLILMVFGPIIYFQDKGSIFYNAPRLGKNGKIFKMYKFRSMKLNAPDIRNSDGSTFNAEDDPRLTSIGKFIRKTSIDETPQILNILKGDMSIVGPRPDLPEHYDLYEENEKEKLKVRPGITGFNQAYFRNTIPWKKRIQNDIYYVSNMSMLLDIKIILKTILSISKSENIFVEKENTKTEH
ncbi:MULTISPECIES: sugar transferase [unclassified Exiguobacterium]|uniref:sugar transferase n=1 Tax=unclassified Exiguobacterium TaxID=2644629 RepID=UPI001BE8DBE6|nr:MULTISPECIES: sugar transferase [unclassified Exiguobacterium]